jgi:hypothetical protein
MKKKFALSILLMGSLLPAFALADQIKPLNTNQWTQPFNTQTGLTTRFSFVAEQSSMSVKLQADNGDADLFFANENTVGANNYVLKSDGGNSNERISLANLVIGQTYYIGVEAWVGFTAASLKVEPDTSTRNTGIIEQDDITLSGDTGDWNWFTYTASNTGGLRVSLTGDNGDADLKVVTAEENVFLSDGSSSNEVVEISTHDQQTVRIGVYAYRQFSNATLSVKALNDNTHSVKALTNSTSLSSAGGDKTVYSFTATSNGKVSIKLNGNNGDADLFVRANSAPTLETFDAQSTSSNSNESVDIQTSTGSTYYILVHAYSAFNNITLSKETENEPNPEIATLRSTVSFNESAAGTWLYKVPVADPNSGLEVRTHSRTNEGLMYGTVELYMKKGSMPTADSYDKVIVITDGESSGATRFNYPRSSTEDEYFLMLKGTTAFGNFWIENWTR